MHRLKPKDVLYSEGFHEYGAVMNVSVLMPS